MENKALESLCLLIQFEDGSSIESDFDMGAGTFVINPALFEAKHDITHLLKVVGINDENIVHVTYIFDGDYMPRHFYFHLGESLRIEDHVEILAPHFDHALQHIALTIQSR